MALRSECVWRFGCLVRLIRCFGAVGAGVWRCGLFGGVQRDSLFLFSTVIGKVVVVPQAPDGVLVVASGLPGVASRS